VRFAHITRLLILLLAAGIAAPEAAAQARPGGDPDALRPPVGHVTIRVRQSSGGPLPGYAVVRLSSLVGAVFLTGSTTENAQVTFRGVPLGGYRVEISSPGYATAEADVEVVLRDTTAYVIVELRPEGISQPVNTPAGPPILAPRARKEMEKGLEFLRADNLKDARAHLDRALKLAPGHPDVYYLLGILSLKQQEMAQARTHLEKAIQIYPKHVQALSTLGSLLLHLKDHAAAVRTLELALAEGSRSWETHWALATAFFHQQQFEKARVHAERALELTQGKLPAADLFVARTLAAEQKRDEALRRVRNFLLRYSDHPLAAEARQFENSLREAGGEVLAGAGVPSTPGVSAELPVRGWTPPDVDDSTPPVEPDVACSLPDVLAETSSRVARMVENLQQFTASEKIEHTEVDPYGLPRQWQSRTFDYVVGIREIRPGMLGVDEMRSPGSQFDSFPSRLVSNGLAAMALLFHPYYVDDFEMRCEGLGRHMGEPAWQIYLRQRADRTPRIRTYRTNAGRFPIRLKGRAWISATTYEVVRLETSLLETVKEIGLEREHLVVDYAPVDFAERKTRLWLPARSEMYVLFRGKRYQHRHLFSDYLLFSVEVGQKIRAPKEP